MPEPITLKYASTRSPTRTPLNPTRLGWLPAGVLATGIGLLAALLTVGPALALVVVVWSVARTRTERRFAAFGWPLLSVVVLALLWATVWSGYSQCLRELELFRQPSALGDDFG